MRLKGRLKNSTFLNGVKEFSSATWEAVKEESEGKYLKSSIKKMIAVGIMTFFVSGIISEFLNLENESMDNFEREVTSKPAESFPIEGIIKISEENNNFKEQIKNARTILNTKRVTANVQELTQ